MGLSKDDTDTQKRESLGAKGRVRPFHCIYVCVYVCVFKPPSYSYHWANTVLYDSTLRQGTGHTS